MGLFDKVERKLESAVNGAFARAFRAEVQPVEIASAMRRAMDERAAVIGKGRTIVPNLFVVELSPGDYERLTSYADLLADELVASAQEHAEQQHYVPGGPFHIDFRSRDDLETGVFRVRPATAKRVPAQAGAEDPWDAAARRRREHAEELRRAHPFRPSESEAPAQGAAGLASHAASAAAGSLASTAAAARAAGAGPYARRADEHSSPYDDGLGAGLTTPMADRPVGVVPPVMNPDERPWLETSTDQYPLIGALTVLGRDASADITLNDAGISRRHAEIRVTHDGPRYAISVRDLGSTNGTFVNGDRVSTRHLEDGDRITVGRTSLVIRLERRWNG